MSGLAVEAFLRGVHIETDIEGRAIAKALELFEKPGWVHEEEPACS